MNSTALLRSVFLASAAFATGTATAQRPAFTLEALNRAGYQGPLSVEWEDIGMEREFGAREACTKIKALDFAASTVAFDAAFARE